MKPTKKIQLEIYKDKLTQFYLALFECKAKENPSPETLRKLSDAIHFDKESVLRFLELSDVQQQKITNKLFAIHKYLLKSKKDSEDYFKVSKDSFEKFQASEFGKDLFEQMKMMELARQWSGKEESAEIKTAVAAMSLFASSLMEGLTKAIGNTLNKTLNTAVALDEAQRMSYKISSSKNGNILMEVEGENEPLEMELFVEREGQIRKIDARDEQDIKLENINSIFLKAENQFIQIKTNADTQEIIHHENVKIKNKKLDLSEAKITERFTIPKEHLDMEITEEADGSASVKPRPAVKEGSENQQSIQAETTEEITLNPNAENFSSSVFTSFDEFVMQFLKIPKNTPEHISIRDKIIISIYELLKKHFPKISRHSRCTVTGYICAQMGWLETEDQHITSKRRQTFRKYLTDTIGNTLKKHEIK